MLSASRSWLTWTLPIVTVAAVLLAWQAVTAGGWVSPSQFPTMSDTMVALGREVATGRVWPAVGATLAGWVIGMVITILLGLLIGTALAFNAFAQRSAAPVIEIFKAIPAIAILPLVILIAGSTLPMKVFLVCFAAFWPFLIQVIYGVRSMDPIVLDTARALGVRGARRFLMVSVPSASPYLVTGMRIASAQALILCVVAEIVGGAAGIGRNILLAQNTGVVAYPTMYAYILVAGILGIALTGAFFLLEKRVMHWHESQRNIRESNKVGAA
ncbi:ABC transporter permease [Microbacterium lushaniae]|uniref:ABC transporter permease n=1 Tax=Microbacterium lushaniae TaxID=2614639 RepID=A0A5J6L7J7_9MICO|nr:ABC transporter permease [Microbacterium lushaniae]QEW04504.1 ABC transporter permease [Microbacterium lushaniae]